MDKKQLPIDKRLINLLHNKLRSLILNSNKLDIVEVEITTEYYRVDHTTNFIRINFRYGEYNYLGGNLKRGFSVSYPMETVSSGKIIDMANSIYNDYFRE